MKTVAHARRGFYYFGKRNVFRLDLKQSREGYFRRGRGRTFPVDGPKTEKAPEPKVESLVLGIWRRRESKTVRRGCVKLKTVTEIRRSSARDTFIAESVDLVLNSLWDWKPVERSKQKRDVVSFTFFQDEPSSTVLDVSYNYVVLSPPHLPSSSFFRIQQSPPLLFDVAVFGFQSRLRPESPAKQKQKQKQIKTHKRLKKNAI